MKEIRKIYEKKNEEENIDINNCDKYLKDKKCYNCIISVFDIKKRDLFNHIPIINSYNTYYNILNDKNIIFNEEYDNEDEIKKCEVYIDNKKIPFSHFYMFNTIGKHIVIYSFKNDLKNINHMFLLCRNLSSINLSYFNTREVSNMSGLFYGCSSLKEINLSRFYTGKVKDMSAVFLGCSSLKEIDISNFETNEVTEMVRMFQGCSSLTSINLFKFPGYTFKRLNVSLMFKDCVSLKKVNLSNLDFDTTFGYECMFEGCRKDNFFNLSKSNKDFFLKYLEKLKEDGLINKGENYINFQ